MSATNYLENKILDHVLGPAAYTKPPAIYVGLLKADPGEVGSAASEVTGGAYARQVVTFSAASAGQITSSIAATFAQATAAWGEITHFGLFDAATGGNMLFYDPLIDDPNAAQPEPLPIQIAKGDQFVFDAGSLRQKAD